LSVAGYTFPLLRLAGYLQNGPPSPSYELTYDNYVVVDADGIVRYTSQNRDHGPISGVGRFADAEIRGAINANLPSAVTPSAWSAVKGLYR